MHAKPYKVIGFRRTRAGCIALQVEFVLPHGEPMTDLGRLAAAAADQLDAYAKMLASPPAAPVQGDAEDVPLLNRLNASSEAVKALLAQQATPTPTPAATAAK